MISKDKTYRTRSGHEVRIYDTEGLGFYPVYGAVKSGETGWLQATWTRDGLNCMFISKGELDLIEYNERCIEMISKDKTYRTEDGRKVRIYATDAGGSYPVHGAIFTDDTWLSSTWTEAGIYSDADKDSPANLVEHNPLSDLMVDDRILVRDVDGETWYKSHFAGISDEGNVETFIDGMTSWSTNRTTEWFQWKLPE